MKKREKYGLIGYPLAHSFSPSYFQSKFEREGIDASYDLFPLESIVDFPSLLKANPDLKGLNVTIPHKQSIIPYLDSVSYEASEIGAVNTIVFQDEKLIGHNTDAFGFASTLEKLDIPRSTKALILGTGGSSKAVQYVLKEERIPFSVVSRTASRTHFSYQELDQSILESHHLVINCTPIGMHPNVEACPNIPYEFISPAHFVIDLVYNPAETNFLHRAAANKSKTIGGLHMLHQQANKAWQLWRAE